MSSHTLQTFKSLTKRELSLLDYSVLVGYTLLYNWTYAMSCKFLFLGVLVTEGDQHRQQVGI